MTKAELIAKLTNQIPSLTKRQVEVVVNTIFDSMREALTHGDKIEIRGFGSFKLRARKMKEGRNPKTGESVLVSSVVVFCSSCLTALSLDRRWNIFLRLV